MVFLAEGNLEDVRDEMGLDPVVLAEFLGRPAALKYRRATNFSPWMESYKRRICSKMSLLSP